jgi:HemY protein
VRALVWLIAVFAAAAAIAVFGRLNGGYALFVVPPWRVELSLLSFGVAAAVVFAAAYAFARVIGRTIALPAQVRAYRERRRRERAHGALAAALQAHLEGRFARAEREARLAWEAGAAPGLAALLAARAAHEMRELERRDRWLQRAAEAGASLQAARLVTEAELALEERDFEAARGALERLHASGPRHIASLRMQLKAELGAQNWSEVLRLTALLAKRGAIPEAAAEEYRTQALLGLLERDATDRRSFDERWRKIPSRDEARPRLALLGARLATTFGNISLAREIVERSLDAEWSGALAARYGELGALEGREREREALERIERAEKWLAEHPKDPQLLAALGRLCAAAELWGKAQRYLETSVAFEDSRAARLDLARLAERLGRPAEAQQHYRRAAEMP